MSWAALFGVFLLSHLAGDFLLQTGWQANHKKHGLGSDPEARRALVWHGLMYTLAFVPALVWVASESGIATGFGVGALVLLPHVIIDDGTLVASWVRHVKHVEGTPSVVVRLGVDQSLHVLTLAGVALLATS
ncbi:MAG TPA: DUF3307 domain-containing protein [Solirubrobacteraceae bacterium]|jgi:hypothetical protein|nr:DUF3307 domain-containing protein [Solirubrobacteraceae bacterium]